ncbi:hypothetical protein DSM3645_03173 [Blastopirellula marina DSM 3645]|uniref:Uncharacterized protein n=1 Tax=Blastopirellula marina DSM 3645 TaxID=314230 RepID=A3ZVU8_9BACT|nr:hypothetical protein DSM3645_03173 [Blastopirellula marina DSM 3645]
MGRTGTEFSQVYNNHPRVAQPHQFELL